MFNLILVLFLCVSIFNQVHADLTVNIFSEKNGKGLETDQNILADELRKLGCTVNCKEYFETPDNVSFADINIFIQMINPEWTTYAPQNWFIPNPEWYVQEIELLNYIDLVLCRTKEVQRIFNKLNKQTYYLGFTSIDCWLPYIPKNYKKFLHVAGSSGQKGTNTIVHIWKKNPHFPFLIVLQQKLNVASETNLEIIPKRVDTNVLGYYQNNCAIHLCLSETEGFGHYIMEALSTGAVVITTNAPPMNEFINDPRCLVAYDRTAEYRLGINYYADADYFEAVINNLLQLSMEDLQAIGKENRQSYLKKTKDFRKNLKRLIDRYSNP